MLLAAILVSGTLCAWWLANRADREMREGLLSQTRLVAGAMNIERIKALTGTEADLETPAYLRLKTQLATVRAANPKCRFVYLMGQRDDGTVFFFADSEPVGSEDESPAGQVYEEVSAEFLLTFETKTLRTEKPVTDRWGTWISALVPLTDPKTNELIAVLGMDIDAREWKWELAGQSIPPVGLTVLALLAVLFIGSFLLDRRARGGGLQPRWMGYLETTLTIAVGLVLTLFAAWLAQTESSRNQAVSFRYLAESRTEALAETFRDLREI